MRILVGVMYSGENEYERCIESIKSQTIANDIDYFVIENQPNKIAHDMLYETFNQQAKYYDYLLKMDADMVFIDGSSVVKMLVEFQKKPNLDHLMVDVYDCLSDIPIPGQNMYSNRVKWEGNESSLIVDYHGNFKGDIKRITDSPLTYHMPNPSPIQAFGFGFHRALKVLQSGQDNRSLPRALIHWTILSKIYDAHLRENDNRRVLALAGAWQVLTKPNLQCYKEYKNEAIQDLFLQTQEDINSNGVESILKPWSNPIPVITQIAASYI